MAEPLEAIYTKIGQAVLDILEVQWGKININVILKPGMIQLKCSYTIVNSSEATSFIPNRSMVDLFKELHDRMVLELHDDWTSADFILLPDGKFGITFGY